MKVSRHIMQQLSLPFEMTNLHPNNPLSLELSFSHDKVNDESARLALEEQYAPLLEETEVFNRRLVSFQANKTETLHSWIKYREGFSAQLVELLLSEFDIKSGQTILDPFAGSCTTLLVAKLLGIDAVGIELLPHCHLAWEAKSKAFCYDEDELIRLRDLIKETAPPNSAKVFPHLTITESAFPVENEQALMNYTHWFKQLDISPNTKTLCHALLMSTLEEISYTRKDGQYLRWDARAIKIVERNRIRGSQGKKSVNSIDKGTLPSVQQVFLQKLNKVIRDIIELGEQQLPASNQSLIAGNVLYELPRLESNSIHGVITSPPYANRYDYTRTYALELAYLNVDEEIFRLRQNLLSCTVENRPKEQNLQDFYNSINATERHDKITEITRNNAALNEIRTALATRNQRGEVNNKGILGMVDQYFTELTFVFSELFRVCQSGASVTFVNDNVRYAGEVIPVDLLSTNLAQQVGFIPHKVYVLPQRKGNSSQQMGRFGRRALRKSITVWRKP